MTVSRQNDRRTYEQKNWIRVTGLYRMKLVVVCILSVSTKEDMYSTCTGMQHQIPTTYWSFRRVSNLPVWFRLHKCDPNSVAGDDRSSLHRNDVLHSTTSLFSAVYLSMLPELCRLQRAEWKTNGWRCPARRPSVQYFRTWNMRPDTASVA